MAEKKQFVAISVGYQYCSEVSDSLQTALESYENMHGEEESLDFYEVKKIEVEVKKVARPILVVTEKR